MGVRGWGERLQTVMFQKTEVKTEVVSDDLLLQFSQRMVRTVRK